MSASSSPSRLRVATRRDVPRIVALIQRSIRGLSGDWYSERQVDSALRHLYGVDTRLVDDGTYFVIEVGRGVATRRGIVAVGGWSYRKTPFGGDQAIQQDTGLRMAGVDPAAIRAFYVDPDHTRRGYASRILQACEKAARAAGFRRAELVSTEMGEAFYRARGYAAHEPVEIELPGGVHINARRMSRAL